MTASGFPWTGSFSITLVGYSLGIESERKYQTKGLVDLGWNKKASVRPMFIGPGMDSERSLVYISHTDNPFRRPVYGFSNNEARAE